MKKSAIRRIGIVMFVWWAMRMSGASAHPLDVGYLDVSRTSTSTVVTVAIHPYQAFELVRGAKDAGFQLERLRQKRALISAYVEDHVIVRAPNIAGSMEACSWDASEAVVPETELDAVADGITISGMLRCAMTTPIQLELETDLFLERFPTQTNIVRLEFPDGFAERATLRRDQRSARIDLSELDVSRPQTELLMSRAPTGTQMHARTAEAQLAGIAKRALDPHVSWWGFAGLLLATMLMGALHALGPGHGKSLMAATMVGSRATYARVMALGTVMTLTHVADVFLMAMGAGAISAILPEATLLRILERFSAGGLVLLGAWNMQRAIRRYRLIQQNPEFASDDDAHRRAHELGLPHTHEQTHEHAGHTHPHTHATEQSFRSILWMGFIGSLAPCPSAWAVFMATLAAGSMGTGIALLVAFTVGLHVTILLIGMLIVASQKFAAAKTPPRFTYALPIASAALVMGVGIMFFWANK